MLDAPYVKIRENGRVVSRAVLIALGMSSAGEREVIGMQVADRESVRIGETSSKAYIDGA